MFDPLDAKKAARTAAAARKTFGQSADELIKSKRREWRSDVHADQWRTTIDSYCGPLMNAPIDAIDTAAVLSVLQPVWSRIPETASRLRGRIEAVLLPRGRAFALSRGSRSPGAAMKRASSFRRRTCLSAGAGPFVSPKAMLSF